MFLLVNSKPTILASRFYYWNPNWLNHRIQSRHQQAVFVGAVREGDLRYKISRNPKTITNTASTVHSFLLISIHPRGIQIILNKQRRPSGRAAGKADRDRGQEGFSFNTPGDTYAKLYQCIMQCEVTEADVDMMMVPVGLWRWWI